MNILLVNQFGPQSGAPTGRILGELASGLQGFGHRPRLATLNSAYGTSGVGWRRKLWEFYSHIILFFSGWFGPRPDVVISLTSPACLAITGGWIALTRRARHIHWAMDLYPDLALKLGELHDGSLARFVSQCMRSAYANADHVVTLDEDMRQYLFHRYGVDSSVIGPFPPEVIWPDSWKPDVSPGRWLYSGNFGRAHEINVLLQVQLKLEKKGIDAELVLQGHGPQFDASKAQAKALGLNRVQWNAPCQSEKLAESLLQANVLIVTRKSELKGLLLPSKLLLAELSGRPVLWIGDVDSHTAKSLKTEGRHGVFSTTQVDAIVAWLEERLITAPQHYIVSPRSTQHARQAAMLKWETLLTSI